MGVFDLYTVVYILAGSGFGLLFGAIPGLTSTAAVAMLIPITYGLDPNYGMGLLIGAFCGGTAGGAISAALLNIPGTPSSICTTLDAYPMVKKGRAGLALGTAMMSSLLGGIFSAFALILLSPYIAEIAVTFGPFEYLSLVVIGLMLSVRISKGSKIKAATSLAIGIFLSLIGTDPITGVTRITFNNMNLRSGIGLLPLMIGFFAIAQVLCDVEQNVVEEEKNASKKESITDITFPKMRDWLDRWKVLLVSCATGCFIGALPGTGGSMASISAYTLSQRVSKNPTGYGAGEIDGVIASESSNNAMTGGALISTLALGIPGDSCTAVILGGMKLLGVKTGPMIFVDNQKFIYGVFVTFIIANITMFVLQFVGMRLFINVLSIPKYMLIPFIVIFSSIGVFSVSHNYFELFEMLFFGFLGFVLIRLGFDIIPCLIGFIMGGIAEKHLRTTIIMYDSFTDIFFRPMALGLSLCIVMLFVSFFIRRKQRD